jgi:hypothetical protein
LGLWHQLRSQAQVDRRRLLHGRERVVVGMVRTAAGRPARGGGQATSPDPRHRPQSGRVQHWCPGRARGSTVPACRPGIFLAGDSARIINPPRPAVGSAATTPRSPGRPQPGLEAVAAVLHGQAGPAPYSIYTYHTMNGTNRTALTIYAAAVLCPVRLPHGSRCRGTPLIDYRAVTMSSTAVTLVGRTRRVGGHLSVALSFKHCEI